jgi:hypothetical protein
LTLLEGKEKKRKENHTTHIFFGETTSNHTKGISPNHQRVREGSSVEAVVFEGPLILLIPT